MENKDDILASFELIEDTKQEIQNENETQEHFEVQHQETAETTIQNEIKTKVEKKTFFKSLLGSLIFFVKYITTSACIFGVLMVVANYSAYMNLAYSFLYAEEMERTKNSLIESVAAASIDENIEETQDIQEVDTFKQLKDEDTHEYTPSMHSLSRIAKKSQASDIDMDIDITPYENRIIIPKIGKNIPLIDIKQKKVEGIDELNDIFMKELENGVIRYPGSGKPGETGNSFVFGHSSNFPWMEGDYNDVFSLLDHVEFDDEVVVYYGQEKHTYKIRTKNVISPGDVSVLKNDENDDRSKLTLMTCWPIGTTLNRLVLTGELIHVEK